MKLLPTDHALAEKVNAEMAKGYITRSRLTNLFCTSDARLERLMFLGLIHALPVKLSKSAGATLQRKNKNLMAKWYIRKPAPWINTL